MLFSFPYEKRSIASPDTDSTGHVQSRIRSLANYISHSIFPVRHILEFLFVEVSDHIIQGVIDREDNKQHLEFDLIAAGSRLMYMASITSK